MKRKEYKTEYKKYQRQRKKGESKRARKDRIKCLRDCEGISARMEEARE